jgi:hypothetical protein
MKKKLESELISIAHRVLKLTGREDLNKMQDEVALLYQKISILKFLQTHFNGEIPEEVATDASFFNALEGAFNNKVSGTVEIDEKVYDNRDNQSNEPLMEPATEKIKDIVAQMPQETAAVDALVDDVNSSDVVEEDLSELSPSFGQLPIFEPLDSDSETEETPAMDDSLTAIKKTSLDEKLKKKQDFKSALMTGSLLSTTCFKTTTKTTTGSFLSSTPWTLLRKFQILFRILSNLTIATGKTKATMKHGF